VIGSFSSIIVFTCRGLSFFLTFTFGRFTFFEETFFKFGTFFRLRLFSNLEFFFNLEVLFKELFFLEVDTTDFLELLFFFLETRFLPFLEAFVFCILKEKKEKILNIVIF
jgi:hypothetical protein